MYIIYMYKMAAEEGGWCSAAAAAAARRGEEEKEQKLTLISQALPSRASHSLKISYNSISVPATPFLTSALCEFPERVSRIIWDSKVSQLVIVECLYGK